MIALSDTTRRASLYVFLLGLTYGIATEVGQALTDGGRQGDVFDAVANTLGVLTGVLAYLAWRRLTPNDPAHRAVPKDH
jgi:VanZ family protein